MDGSKQIGITGAGGFIGQNLAKHLSKKYSLVLFDIKKSFDLPNSKWVLKDLNNCEVKDFEEIDLLIHFAGSPTNKDAFQKNFVLTKKVLNCCIKAKVKLFYFVSSYAVYGNRETPAKITSKRVSLDNYSLSKILAENLVQNSFQKKEINGSILRFCSIYGGRKGLIDLIKGKIKKGEKIVLNGLFYRQYLHIEDLCKFLVKIIELKNPKKIYNLEGEKINSLDIKNLLDKRSIQNDLIKSKKISYLLEGSTPERNMSVEKYLIEN